MILCRADITTKNPKKVNRYLKNFDSVEKKIKKVIEIDEQRLFQSPIKGHEIMKLCGLNEGKKVGEIKKAIDDQLKHGRYESSHLVGDGTAGTQIAKILATSNLKIQKQISNFETVLLETPKLAA